MGNNYCFATTESTYVRFTSCIGEVFSPEPLYKQWASLSIQELKTLGEKYNLSNSPDSALVCFSIISERLNNSSNESDKKYLARAFNNLGYIYATYFSDYQRSMQFLQKAENISMSINYTEDLAYVAMNKGGVFMACNRIYGNNLFINEIWDCSRKGIEYAIKSGEWSVALIAIINLSALYPDNPRPKEYSEISDMIQKAKIPENTYMYRFANIIMEGTFAYIRKDYGKAAQIYSRLEHAVQPDDMQAPRLKAIGLAITADALASSGNIEGAIDNVKSWLDLAHHERLYDEIPQAYHKLSMCYALAGNQALADENRLRYLETKDSIMTAKEVSAISNIPLIALNDNLSAKVNMERMKKERLIKISIISGIFLLLLTLYVFQLIRSRCKLRKYSREIYKKYVDSLKVEKETQELRDRFEHKYINVLDEKKYKNSPIDKNIEVEIIDKIMSILADTKIISNPEFSLSLLSEQVGYSYKKVSQVINDKLGKNFKTLLAEARIKAACSLLLNQEEYGRFTLEHISRTVGFKSRSTFSTVFKQVVGISPVEFRRNSQLS